MKKNLLGAIIGFASGLYIASALLNKIISRKIFCHRFGWSRIYSWTFGI